MTKMRTIFNPNYLAAQIKLLFIISFLMTSCGPSMPAFIEDVWTSDPPEIGKVVTLGVRIKSISDEDNIVFVLSFPDKIASNENTLRWEFGMNANQERVFYTDICVLETGSWRIDASIASIYDDGEIKYSDLTAIGVISYPHEEKVLLERDITYSQRVETERATIPRYKITAQECTR